MNTKRLTLPFKTTPGIPASAKTPLICLWRSTGKPGTPLVCVWKQEPRTTTNVVEFPAPPEDGLRLCA